ncbi:MAG: sigma-70 family RNA polymerase sigma factor [Gemmataceae bacterium]|nr:sigma-70 family RNA polymerase sigma factor [Gemmataceae bacterium]
MNNAQTGVILRQLQKLNAPPGDDRLLNEQLLARFVRHKDPEAFAALVRRHGSLVLNVCRSVLRQQEDAEDVFQATFLVLARKAATIKKQASVASWLHGVAFRIAQKAKVGQVKRRFHEQQAKPQASARDCDDMSWRDLRRVLHEEVNRLSEKLRAPLLLCYWDAMTQDEAARQLGIPKGTLKDRLERARHLLHHRLGRRGVSLSAALFVTLLCRDLVQAAPALLLKSTVQSALLFAAGQSASVLSAKAIALAEGICEGLSATKAKLIAVLLILSTLVAAGAGALVQKPTDAATPRRVAPHAIELLPEDENAALARTDVHGDPLPPGALLRFGTVRFRHGETISQVAFSPDGKYLASAGQNGESNSNPNSICLWDRASGKLLRRLEGPRLDGNRAHFLSLAFSPDSKLLAAQSFPGSIHLWETATGKVTRELCKGGVTIVPTDTPAARIIGAGFVFSPDGKYLAACDRDKAIHFWEVATGKDVRKLVSDPEIHAPLAFTKDGATLATSGDKHIQLWNTHTGKEIGRLEGHNSPAGNAAFSADNKILVAFTGSPENPYGAKVFVWDVTERKVLRSFEVGRKGGLILSAALSPDLGSALLGGHPTTQIDLATGKEIRRFARLDSNTHALAFSPDGKTVAEAGNNRTVQLWNAETGAPLAAATGHSGIVQSLSLSADGKTLASVAADRSIWLWDATTGKPRTRIERPSVSFTNAIFSPDGVTLAATADDAFVRLLETATGKESRRLTGKTPVRTAAFSPDGRVLAAGGGEGRVWLFDADSGKKLHEFTHPRPREAHAGVLGVAFSPDGRFVASAGWGEFAAIWHVETGKLWRQLPGHDYWVSSLSFSPDGKTLATTGWDKTIRLWELSTGKIRMRFDGHSDRLAVVAFSPDGLSIASGSDDKTVRIWDVRTGQELGRFLGHENVVGRLCFAADGKTLYSGSWDTTILAWDMNMLVKKRQPPAKLTAKDMEATWNDLASEDAPKAGQAVWALVADSSMDFLKKQLRPLKSVDGKRLARLIEDLDSAQFEVRQRAAKELDALADLAEPALRKALSGQPTLEARQRLKQLLDKLEGPITSPKLLREFRAVEVLEKIGGAEAKQLLTSLAAGAPDAWLTREARLALERLKRAAN